MSHQLMRALLVRVAYADDCPPAEALTHLVSAGLMVESGAQMKTALAGNQGLTTITGGSMAENQSTQNQAALVAPRALCPACGRLALHSHIQATSTVATATYLCEVGHGFIVKWVMV